MKKERKSTKVERALAKPRASQIERVEEEEEKGLDIFSAGGQAQEKINREQFKTSFERQMAAEVEDVYKMN